MRVYAMRLTVRCGRGYVRKQLADEGLNVMTVRTMKAAAARCRCGVDAVLLLAIFSVPVEPADHPLFKDGAVYTHDGMRL